MKTLYESLGLDKFDKDTLEDRPTDSMYDIDESVSSEEFARRVVNSPEYRRSIIRRIDADKLAPAVETKLLDHALGKIPDKVTVSGDISISRVEFVIIDALKIEPVSEPRYLDAVVSENGEKE